jgi:hypothetical protein
MALIQGWSLPTQELSRLCVRIEESCGATISLMSPLTAVYHLRPTLPYIWPRWAPHRAAGQPRASAGLACWEPWLTIVLKILPKLSAVELSVASRPRFGYYSPVRTGSASTLLGARLCNMTLLLY